MKFRFFIGKAFIGFNIVSAFIVALIINNNFALSDNLGSKSSSINFAILESSVIEGSQNSVNSVNIQLPSASWNLTDLEINFTNIEFGINTKIIEDQNYTKKEVYYQNKNLRTHGLAIQIKLTQPTIIYGFYIYGMRESRTIPENILVQLRGYNSTNNRPNKIIYSSCEINMSSDLKWYLQNFTLPISLLKGNYSLVLNGSNITTVNHDRFIFYCNDDNPIDPTLHFSNYSEHDQWSNGVQNCTLLHKLNCKINKSVIPENINMTTQINDNFYKVSNGQSEGMGYTKITNANLNTDEPEIVIQVKNNISSQLIFDFIYQCNISNLLQVDGILNIEYNNTNSWTLTPEIIKISNNHTIKFNYPRSWDNIQILKNGGNVTSDVIIDTVNNFLLIPNNIIQNGVSWEIKAYSPNINFNLNVGNTEFKLGQELQFSIGNPILQGNYSSIIINPNKVPNVIDFTDNIFSYNIPKDGVVGNYIAYVFWYNQTDAGVQSLVFQISEDPENGINYLILIITSVIITGGFTIGIASYKIIKKLDTKRREKLRLILEKCTDIMNLDHIIVLDIKSGVDIFSQSFGGENKEIQATLISGFLQALHNFGTEVIKSAKGSRTIKVEYKDYIIIMSECINLRVIILMNSHPSKNFIYSIEDLASDIYNHYGKLIDNFNGGLKPFLGIKKIIEKNLNVSLLYPLTVAFFKGIKLDHNEKEILQKALTFMKEHNFKYFYSLYLLPDNASSPKDYEAILSLIEKGVFRPIDRDNN